MNILEWLKEWYKSNCNGDWEHNYGITIENVDNPGWYINIDLWDTELENKPFDEVQIHHNEQDWLFCRVENNKFMASGDPDKLIKILEIFRNWQEANDEEN